MEPLKAGAELRPHRPFLHLEIVPMKHSYQTRRLLALRDTRHDGQNVVNGGEIFATETDARYLIRTGQARDPEERAKEQTRVAPDPAPPARRGPSRPPKVEVAARAPAPAPAAAPAAPAAGAPDGAPAGAMTIANFGGAPDGSSGEGLGAGAGAGETGSDAAA